MKKSDLLILIAVWEFITAFFSLVGLGGILMLALQSQSWWMQRGVDFDLSGPWIYFSLVIAGLVLLLFMAVALAAGFGLLGGREYGRIMSLVHGGISLLFFPVGTVIGVLQIVYLTRSDIKEYIK
ncbi:hypothetical protein DGWBC_0669 [Dehalogenimonas sp. WBC-2]|nr:hypothetical protein DGWBC_0669 [Dehalogenimonas sp. WBC-2]